MAKIKGIFEPFNKYVTDQLKTRQSLLFNGNLGNRPELFHAYTTQKQACLRLSSGVNIKQENDFLGEGEEELIGSEYARKWVLEAGILDVDRERTYRTDSSLTDENIDNPIAEEVESTDTTETDASGQTTYKGIPRSGIGPGGAYGDPVLRSDRDGDYGIVPMPGIIDATVRTKSDDGSLREAEINFVCHNRRQLEALELLYMRPGYVLMLEWGWNGYVSNFKEVEAFPGALTEFWDPNSTLETINQAIRRRKVNSGANYDAIVGFCRNFSFKANGNGGFDCTTEIIGQGELLESLKSAVTSVPITTEEGLEDEETIDTFLFMLRSINENLRKAGASKYLKLKGTDAATTTYWERSSWKDLLFDVWAFSSGGGLGASYVVSKVQTTTDNLSESKLKGLDKTEATYLKGFESIISLVKKIIKVKEDDIEHDAYKEYGKYENNVEVLLHGMILKETSKIAYNDGETDTGERKKLFVRWDLICEIINKFCTPQYKTTGEGLMTLSYQTPFAKTIYYDTNLKTRQTGSDGSAIHSYLNYAVPSSKDPNFNKYNHKLLGQSFDNDVCIMPHQDPVANIIRESLEFKGRVPQTDLTSNPFVFGSEEDDPTPTEETPTEEPTSEIVETNQSIYTSDFLDLLNQDPAANVGSDRMQTIQYQQELEVEADEYFYEKDKPFIEKQLEEVDLEEIGEEELRKKNGYTYQPLTQDESVEYDTNSIGLIYMNLDFLIKTYEDMRFDVEKDPDTDKSIKRLKEKFNFFDYITKIWDGVNEACAGYYDFSLHTEHERPNVIRIVDLTYNGTVEPTRPLFKFNPQGLGSISREYYFDSKIDSDFADTVSIAAQAPNQIHSLDAMSFKSFHKNIKNRFTEQDYTDEQRKGDAEAARKALERDVKKYKKLMRRLRTYASDTAKSYYVGEYIEGIGDEKQEYKFGSSQAKRASKEIGLLINSIKQRYPLYSDSEAKTPHPKAGQFIEKKVSLERNAIIPLEFNISLDGIAGIIPLQVFKINKDKLPYGYQSDEIVFIVKGETCKITAGQDWVTEINGQLTLLNNNPNEEGTNAVEEDGKEENSESNQGDKLDEKAADEVRSEQILNGVKQSSKLTFEDKINSLDPSMREVTKTILKGLEDKGHKPLLFFAHRTIGEQKEILAKGNSTIPFSFHNTYKDGKPAALAIDVVDSRYYWQGPAADTSYKFWTDLGELCKANGLDWGGDWRFVDVAHCETPSVTVAQARNQSKPDIGKADWEWIQSKLA